MVVDIFINVRGKNCFWPFSIYEHRNCHSVISRKVKVLDAINRWRDILVHCLYNLHIFVPSSRLNLFILSIVLEKFYLMAAIINWREERIIACKVLNIYPYVKRKWESDVLDGAWIFYNYFSPSGGLRSMTLTFAAVIDKFNTGRSSTSPTRLSWYRTIMFIYLTAIITLESIIQNSEIHILSKKYFLLQNPI